MHELGLVTTLLEHVLQEAAQGGLKTVTQVVLELGELQSVEPDLVREAFAVLSEGTAAEGAVLSLVTIKAQARCRICGRNFEPSYFLYVCPSCGKADAEILAGRELRLQSLSGEALEN